MSSEMAAALIVIALFTSALLFVRFRFAAGHDSADQEGLPADLVGAELAYAERTFRSRQRRLVAKLDRAYRVDGELKLVELKTRARDEVYMSDIIELSVQRLALQDGANEVVSPQAWVIVQNTITGARRPHKVRLMGTTEVTDMKNRYRAIVVGKVREPAPARAVRQCASCGHRDRCSATFNDRH
jgi:PD-(D/E)XK nuclease superfamily